MHCTSTSRISTWTVILAQQLFVDGINEYMNILNIFKLSSLVTFLPFRSACFSDSSQDQISSICLQLLEPHLKSYLNWIFFLFHSRIVEHSFVCVTEVMRTCELPLKGVVCLEGERLRASVCAVLCA